MKPVPKDLLEAIGRSVPHPPEPSVTSGRRWNSTGRAIDVAQWIAEHGLELSSERLWQNGRRWVFHVCPGNPDHRDRSAYLVQFPSGAVAAGCHHNGCQGKDWQALRDVVEPGWRNHRNGDGPWHGGRITSDTHDADTRPPERLEDQEALGSTNRDDVEPFPMEVLPAALAQFVREGAQALRCPPDLIGVPLLAVAGAAIGTARVIEVKPGWHEGPRIYGTAVAEPGAVESPALDLVARPLYRKQQALLEEFLHFGKHYQEDLARYEVQLQVWKEDARKAAKAPKGAAAVLADKPEEPTKPTLVRVFTTDATVEALAGLLQDNLHGLIPIRDELTGWVRAMNQYKGGRGADRQFYLSAWSGAPCPVDRKSGLPILLFNPFLNVVGCIPPDMLTELADERGREDRFIHRLLFAYPDPVPWQWAEEKVSAKAQAGWQHTIEGLLHLSPVISKGETPRPKIVSFTEGGNRMWVQFCEAHAQEMRDRSLASNLHGP